MKTLLLDADGVFVDFVKGFLGAIKEATGKTFAQDQIREFDIAKALGLTEEEIKATYAQVRRGFCRNLDPIPGAIEAIQRLNLIADIYVVTSPLSALDTWAHEREAWIKERLGFSNKRIISTSAKHLVHGDFLVDDRAENCESWNMARTGTAVIWESPWNVNYPWHGHRFNDWTKLERLVQSE
jgi:5'-nucleotidase